jgi:DNA-binding response OmpR family regulator
MRSRLVQGKKRASEGLAAGADDYLVKPFSARELRARVDAAIVWRGCVAARPRVNAIGTLSLLNKKVRSCCARSSQPHRG